MAFYRAKAALEIRGIESGDEVRVERDDILVQTGGFTLVKGDEFLFQKLEEKGFIRRGHEL